MLQTQPSGGVLCYLAPLWTLCHVPQVAPKHPQTTAMDPLGFRASDLFGMNALIVSIYFV